ncbi:MAG: cystathionine beta-lyase [Turicibacter sp.]|nr:cystathionine beta-lyase [Turicibacter sp.]
MDVTFQTKLHHNDYKVDQETGALSTPLHHTSTFHQFDFDSFGKFDYSRSGNPTREALESIIAELEGGVAGFAFASGMAAISTALLLLSAGDHLLISEDVYGGTYRLVSEVLSRLGVEHSFVDMANLNAVRQGIRPNTKAFYIETPSNPTMKVTDIGAVAALAKGVGALTFVDNTFLTPQLQRPLDLGADIVLHSATKFLSGHSDVVAGLAVVKNKDLAKRLGFLQNSFGAVLGAQDCWLVLRGLKTLHVRLAESQRSAQKMAGYLESHPLIKAVHYPGLKSHPQYRQHKSQASGPGAVLSFELGSVNELKIFLKHVKLPAYAVSLGGVESILSYPAKMSHAAMPAAERQKRGISDGLIRLSVGLEQVDDLIADFEQALGQVKVRSLKLA